MVKPEGLTSADVLSYAMPPGTLLWNQLLTPHWVDAVDAVAGETDGVDQAAPADRGEVAGTSEVAASINLSHGGLRLEGELSPAGKALERFYRERPERRF